MREIRTSGSEGGGGLRPLSTPIRLPPSHQLMISVCTRTQMTNTFLHCFAGSRTGGRPTLPAAAKWAKCRSPVHTPPVLLRSGGIKTRRGKTPAPQTLMPLILAPEQQAPLIPAE
jgi:hypothetical protein